MKTTNTVAKVVEYLSDKPFSANKSDMRMFSTLYRSPVEAAMREYLSNAYDAHMAKGGELPPIQVTLPRRGDARPSFRVRDFGNGLSEEELVTYIGAHGESTRQHSNEFMGGYGLGAKSGFALGDEFFLTSYQSGTGLRARASMDDMSQGHVEVIERFVTEEPDGLLVEVKVSARDLENLDDESVSRLLMAFEPTAIEVASNDFLRMSVHNPKQFSCLELNGSVRGWVDIEIHKGARARRARKPEDGKLLIVVGKAVYDFAPWKLDEYVAKYNDGAYDRASDFLRFLTQISATHVLNVPIGSVDLSYSRDRIRTSKRSIETLVTSLEDYHRLLHAELQHKINALPSHHDAVEAIIELERDYYSDTALFNWRGQKLGFAQLKDSTAIIRQAFYAGAKNENYKVNNFPRFSSFWYSVAKESTTVIIPVATDEDVTVLSKELDNVETLTLMRCLSKAIEIPNPRNSNLLVVAETDGVREMFPSCPVVGVSAIRGLITALSKK